MSTDNKLRAVIEKYKGHPEFLGIKITNPNQPGAVDDTLLHIAARRGDVESMEVLIECGALVNIAGDLGNTPLHQAAMRGQLEAVRFLLRQGADLTITNEFGQTASNVAEIGGHKEIVGLLKDAATS